MPSEDFDAVCVVLDVDEAGGTVTVFVVITIIAGPVQVMVLSLIFMASTVTMPFLMSSINVGVDIDVG